MADDSDETGGFASVKPDFLPGEHPGAGGGFLPPLDIAVDVPDFRYAKLSKIIGEHVLPRLVALHEAPPAAAPAALPAIRMSTSPPIRDAAVSALAVWSESAALSCSARRRMAMKGISDLD